MWWLGQIVSYGKDKDLVRMNKNLQSTSMEIPNMVLLVKDHKQWNPESGAPVPTRPVVSGNRGINTPLSEWLAEITEPVALNMQSAEVNSTEEAIARMDQINECIVNGGIQQLDPIGDIGKNSHLTYWEDSYLDEPDDELRFLGSIRCPQGMLT